MTRWISSSLVLLTFWLLGCADVEAATINAATCNSADVQSAIQTAANGDTVTIPNGTCTWTTGVAISSKAVKVRGGGSGRIIARSESNVPIDTGTKIFTTQAGLEIIGGQVLRVSRTGDRETFMQGTVTSYSGTTLTLNITSTGTGTRPPTLWIISTAPTTVIINNSASAPLFQISESTVGSVDISGIKFAAGTGAGPMLNLFRVPTGKPILVHDSWFESKNTSGDMIRTNTNRGVIWNCSFDSSPFSMAPLAVHVKDSSNVTVDSWTSAARWGALDTDGTNALYIEDSDFHAWLNAIDNDDNGRLVVRHTTFNNAGFGTHGADTSFFGQRYFEVYDSQFIFNGYNDGSTFNLNWWFFVRGGSFLITDTVLPDIRSTDYGDKTEIKLTVMNLQRNAGAHGCWGAGTSNGLMYPAPRQVGMGRVTASASSDQYAYVGDSEPAYIWNNSGSYRIGLPDYGGTECLNPDGTSNYVVAGRDYFNGTPKPGYQKFVYPHPLTTSGPARPSNLRVQ